MPNSTQDQNRVSATEFKKNLGQYFELALSGHAVHITKHGGRSVILQCSEVSEDAGKTGAAEASAAYSTARKRMSYNEFLSYSESSVERLEFIDGEIYMLSSPSIRHQLISKELLMQLHRQLTGNPCKAIQAPLDVTLCRPDSDMKDVCQPDLVVACDLSGKINEKGQYMGTPALVVEVASPATRSRDLLVKLNLYMRSGVKEYWYVDPDHESLTAYTFDSLEIQDCQTYRKDEMLSSSSLPGICISLAEVFSEL